MLLITNRCPKRGPSSKTGIAASNGHDFTFDLDENGSSNSVHFCSKQKRVSIAESAVTLSFHS